MIPTLLLLQNVICMFVLISSDISVGVTGTELLSPTKLNTQLQSNIYIFEKKQHQPIGPMQIPESTKSSAEILLWLFV